MNARTPFAYAVVACICIALHNAVLILADCAAIPLWLGVLLSFVIVVSVGYVLHSLFTFRCPPSVVAFARYAIAMSANIPLAFGTTWFWHDQVGLPMVSAAPVASMCMLALNFMLGRWAISAPSRRTAS